MPSMEECERLLGELDKERISYTKVSYSARVPDRGTVVQELGAFTVSDVSSDDDFPPAIYFHSKPTKSLFSIPYEVDGVHGTISYGGVEVSFDFDNDKLILLDGHSYPQELLNTLDRIGLRLSYDVMVSSSPKPQA